MLESPTETEYCTDVVIVPDDLFDEIAEYDDLKEAIKLSLKSNSTHFRNFLFIGHPGTAKSMFLESLARLPGISWYTDSAKPTKAGVRELLIQDRPHILLFDEIDKASISDISVLLTATDER